MKAIDLFCGCGGLTLGLKQAGFDVIGAIDIDSLAIESYSLNHPEIKIWEEDIRSIRITALMKALNIQKGELDLLAGCPPCQGFSSLRTFNGGRVVADVRNDLVYQFIRFIDKLRPKAVMMENVPGLVKDERLHRVIRKLEMMGYSCDTRIVNAADYGVPQRRKRMILLAGVNGNIDYPLPNINKKSVRDAIYSMPEAGKSGDDLHDFPEKRSEAILSKIHLIPKNGGSRTALPEDKQLECHKKKNSGFKDIYGRMAWDYVAPTITSGCTNPSKGRFLHPELDRAITLREAAILQTFPKDYLFSLKHGKGAAAIMIGNALPPEMIRQHSLMIRNYLESFSK